MTEVRSTVGVMECPILELRCGTCSRWRIPGAGQSGSPSTCAKHKVPTNSCEFCRDYNPSTKAVFVQLCRFDGSNPVDFEKRKVAYGLR